MDLFSIWHLLVILAVVILLFGTSKVRNIGSDLGGAIKNFRNAMKEESAKGEEEDAAQPAANTGRVIEGQARAADGPKAKSAAHTRKG
ncbi:Sec-independent protein translocase subunit TatA [Acidiferrobacter sp.]|uniref:Sec-independent protein translocase subunit TatA n=1 Tax=Acidiferrobacter sp. TaxID=1872107 RepID=UPI0026080BFC|nr:Sec-independent protein translocase subunit TatA [Acidiferrobacter sp.]